MKKPILTRLMEKVSVESGPLESPCWLWTAHTIPNGYGRIRNKGPQRLVHRVSYELFVGPIPEGLQIDHLCRVRHSRRSRSLRSKTRVA